jgi:glycosyltransferase involved in cell wall biosynthesis
MVESNGLDKGPTAVKQETGLSVFFPCYNEQDVLAELTEKTISVLDNLCRDYEVIIVNDGSTDETAQIADGLALKYPPVRVVHHDKNKGYGSALASGFDAARKELVFYTDGDGQFDICELVKLFEPIKSCDIVSCYRQNREDNFIRKVNAFCWNKLVCLIFKIKIKDIDCAFKLYRKEIFEKISIESSGALVDTEILVKAYRNGRKITQIPVRHYPRKSGSSSGADIKVILLAFKELFKLRKKILSQG